MFPCSFPINFLLSNYDYLLLLLCSFFGELIASKVTPSAANCRGKCARGAIPPHFARKVLLLSFSLVKFYSSFSIAVSAPGFYLRRTRRSIGGKFKLVQEELLEHFANSGKSYEISSAFILIATGV